MSVYFIQAGIGGRIKIGYSPRPRQRIEYIQRYNGVKLITLACITGTAGLEKALHRILAEHRAHGEWFEPVPRVLDLARRAASLPQDYEGRQGDCDLEFSSEKLDFLIAKGGNAAGAAERARTDPYNFTFNVLAGVLGLFPEEGRAE